MDVDVALPAEAPVVSEEAQPDATVLAAIMAALSEKRPTVPVEMDTDIFAHGLADSQAFLDLIFDVDGKTGMMFDAETVNFDKVTPLGLAMAFKAP